MALSRPAKLLNGLPFCTFHNGDPLNCVARQKNMSHRRRRRRRRRRRSSELWRASFVVPYDE